MKFNFIMFCHNNSFKQKSDIIKQVKYIYPDSIQTIYSAEDLPKEINDYADLYPRGYGYYLWKPYIILQKLNEISDNDIILYADSRCHLRGKCNWLEDFMKNIEYDIACWNMYHKETFYTRSDIFNRLNIKLDLDKGNLFQTAATFIAFRKNNQTLKFVNEWYTFMNNNKDIINDVNLDKRTIECMKNPGFIENRHDQSVFSLLIKKYSRFSALSFDKERYAFKS